VRERLAGRIDSEGRLYVISSEHREQGDNLEAALARMEALLRTALHRQKVRRPTRPTGGSRRRRLEDKRRTGERKRDRRSVD
jgi:ribosome-associated protein